MKRYQVKYVDKGYNDVEHITHVGGFGTKGWKMTVTGIIGRIEGGEEEYYTATTVNGRTVEANIEVAKSSTGRKYIRSHRDGTVNDNLNKLPPIPANHELIG